MKEIMKNRLGTLLAAILLQQMLGLIFMQIHARQS
jgi:hypothetical protein